jgi:GAF domain-containing protein
VVYRLDADETTSERYRQYLQGHPIRVDDGSAAGRAVQLRKPVHIEDIKNDPEYRRFDLTDQVPFRNVLAVPLLRAGEPIGVIALSNTVGGSASRRASSSWSPPSPTRR